MRNKLIALFMAAALITNQGIVNTVEVQASNNAQNVAATYNLLAGTTVHVLPKYTQASGTTYTYTSGNSGVATVDSQGNVTGVSEGTTTILVKRTITNTTNTQNVTATPTAGEKVSMSERSSNFTTTSTGASGNTQITATPTSAVSDWNLPTNIPSPTTSTNNGQGNYIEGLTDATPTPIPKPTNNATVTAKAQDSAQSGAVKTTSVSSYALYTVNVVPLVINTDKTTIGLGDTLKLTTNLADSVSWKYSFLGDSDSSSSSEQSGNMYEFTPKEVGEYTIQASYGSVSNSVTITVIEKSEKQKELESKNKKKVLEYIDKNGFKFTDTSSELAVGDSIAFSTNLDKLSYANVSWSSTDTKVATVSANGLVTGVSEGQAKIVASIAGKKIAKKVQVTADSTFKFLKVTDELAVGDKFTLKVNKDSDVKWSSSNENVLTVDEGVIVGKSIGVATIEVSYKDVTLKKTISVTGDSTALHVTSTENTVNVNEKIMIETNRENCKFSIDNANVAIIDPITGVLTGKSAGSAVITIECGSEKITYKITVTEGKSQLAFVGMKDTYSTGVSSIIQVNKSNASFISSNTAVATIDRNTGKLKTLTEGVTVIYAFSGTEQVSQQIKVTSLGKDEMLKTLAVGDTATLSSNEENVTWSSSNQNVVKINELTGKLEAVGVGTCMIYMYSEDKITFTEVSVRKAAYTAEQQKAISDANKYICVLLSEDGESLKLITSANSDTMLTYLKECRKYLDICENLGVDVKTLKYYDLYDAGLNQYLVSTKGYSNGTLISLEEGKQLAVTSINQAILSASTLEGVALQNAVSNILDLIKNAEDTYLVTKDDINMYDVLEELISLSTEGNTATE